jgi:sRNA-binding protein
MPARTVKITLAAALAALTAGAVYLYAVRGPAILLDLTGLARGALCL